MSGVFYLIEESFKNDFDLVLILSQLMDIEKDRIFQTFLWFKIRDKDQENLIKEFNYKDIEFKSQCILRMIGFLKKTLLFQ